MIKKITKKLINSILINLDNLYYQEDILKKEKLKNELKDVDVDASVSLKKIVNELKEKEIFYINLYKNNINIYEEKKVFLEQKYKAYLEYNIYKKLDNNLENIDNSILFYSKLKHSSCASDLYELENSFIKKVTSFINKELNEIDELEYEVEKNVNDQIMISNNFHTKLYINSLLNRNLNKEYSNEIKDQIEAYINYLKTKNLKLEKNNENNNNYINNEYLNSLIEFYYWKIVKISNNISKIESQISLLEVNIENIKSSYIYNLKFNIKDSLEYKSKVYRKIEQRKLIIRGKVMNDIFKPKDNFNSIEKDIKEKLITNKFKIQNKEEYILYA